MAFLTGAAYLLFYGPLAVLKLGLQALHLA
ncbi:hypothetical protein DFR76_111202 [Nocardia pseudobrasiliensis]|uniref:Uncharacterized protein n=1 Tax=Nocardia pseudobrasiliensis TaxID=45979 RepID=A0A370I1P6_9NOCA|nr:hypothetical protein DFR76_111202 [Nocardia pseudobrasiliensis]